MPESSDHPAQARLGADVPAASGDGSADRPVSGVADGADEALHEDTGVEHVPASDVEDFAQEIADQVESFLIALREIARAENHATAVPMLLLEVSQLMLAGGRLGAITDVVPVERFEPDTGPDPDLDELRERLGYLLADVDVYTEVFDPYSQQQPELLHGRLSDDLAGIAAALVHGLKHHRAGRIDEALWWWQFSYLSSWGSEAGAVLRALHSVVAHARLDSGADDRVRAEDAAAAEVLGDVVRHP
ncbi:DUF5063 domain-containing protein [Actinopolymorpha alba]|uniref:DUF5063 domain-containing protein n=1 Tax=Actinopolymorpha alba TaxID=533267 RepID=UPI0003741623|nr:DUF5063 domain-containing protein [Actinopolymorpha alba]